MLLFNVAHQTRTTYRSTALQHDLHHPHLQTFYLLFSFYRLSAAPSSGLEQHDINTTPWFYHFLYDLVVSCRILVFQNKSALSTFTLSVNPRANPRAAFFWHQNRKRPVAYSLQTIGEEVLKQHSCARLEPNGDTIGWGRTEPHTSVSVEMRLYRQFSSWRPS